MHKCEKCGSTNVVGAFWVNLNNHLIDSTVDSQSEDFCNDCEDFCAVIEDDTSIELTLQELKQKINKLIALNGEDYTDGEIINLIADLTNFEECKKE